MANYQENFTAKSLWVNPFSRNGQYPLDATSIFYSKEDAERYARSIEAGKALDDRKYGSAAYVGQIITVYANSKVDVYKIEENLTLSQVGGTDVQFKEYSELAQLVGSVKLGQMFYVTDSTQVNKNGFYIWTGTDFKFLDTSDGSIAGDALAKVESAITGLQNEVGGIKTNISNNIYTKTQTDSAITTALEDYVLDGDFESYKTTVTTELNKKADKSAVEAKADATALTTLSNKVDNMYTNVQIDEFLSNKSDSGHNHDGKYVSKDEYDVDKLTTENAIKAIPTKYTITGDGGVYTLFETKNDVTTSVGTINIPKDTVVKSGYVTDLAEGEIEGKPAGTYIVLELANSDDILYVPADKLVDTYTNGDSHVVVSDYKISLNISSVAASVAADTQFAKTFVKADDNATALTTLETSLQNYANTAAGAAETAAKTHTDTELQKYVLNSSYEQTVGTLATKTEVTNLVTPISTAVEGLGTDVLAIQNIVNSDTVGNNALKTTITNVETDLSNVKVILGTEAQGETASSGVFAKIDTINTTITGLDNNVVKVIKVNNTEFKPVNNIVTIVPVDSLDSATDRDLVSAKAIKDAITNINTAISNKSSIVVVDSLPSVDDAIENTLYVGKNSDGKYTEVIKIDNEFKTFGEDRFVNKDDYATVDTYGEDGEPLLTGKSGIISSADYTKLMSITALTAQEVLNLLN